MRVFISYSSSDGQMVAKLVDSLKQVRPDWDPFFDQHSLRTGYWMPQLAKGVESAEAFIFLFGNRLGPWQTIEYYGAFDKRVKDNSMPIVPVLIDDAAVPGLPFLEQLQWLNEANPSETDAVARIASALEHTDATEKSAAWRYVDPYRGLKALREEDSALLFGRDNLVEKLVRTVATPSGKVVMAVGNSGIGKSSLIFAGVLAALGREGWISKNISSEWPAALEQSRSWVRLKMAPREDPLKQLAGMFVAQWLDPRNPAYHETCDQWQTRLAKSESSITELILAADEGAKEKGADPPQKYVIYVDQGEELYTRADKTQAQRFSELLAEIASNERCRVIMSIRADFYGKLQEDAILLEASEKIDIPPLTKAGLYEVVEQPAKRFGAKFESGLIDKLVEAAHEAPSGLPLLSYQMDALWSEMVTRDDGTLQLPPQVREFEIASALIDKADGYLSAHPDLEQPTRRLFCSRLAHVPQQGAPTRQVTLFDSLSSEEQQVVKDLSGAEYRLLSTGENEEGEATVEIGHEALLTSWNRLKNWIADRRSFYAWLTGVQSDRISYDAKPERKALLQGRPLETAQIHLGAYPEDIPKSEQDYIADSKTAEQKDTQRQTTVRRSFFAFVTAAFIGMAAILYWAVGERRDGLEFQSRAIAADVQSLLNNNEFELATLVALEAWKDEGVGILAPIERLIRPDRQLLINTLTRSAINHADEQLLSVRSPGHTNYVNSAVFSSDNSRILTASNDGTARIWDTETGQQFLSLEGHRSRVSSAVFSSEDSRILTASGDGTARIWDAETGQQLLSIEGHADYVNSAVFSSDDSRILTAGNDWTARIWDAETGQQLLSIEGHVDYVTSAVFSSDDSRILTANSDRTARVWDAETGQELLSLEGHEGRVTSAVFSSDDSRILTASSDKTARVWDAETGQQLLLLEGHGTWVSSAVFSSDDSRILTAGSDGTARIWDAETGQQLLLLEGHRNQVSSAVFSSDDSRILTAGNDWTARIWDTETGQQHLSLEGHGTWVSSAVFSSDDSRILTAGNYGTARVWDAETGQQRLSLKGHKKGVSSAVFSSDNSRILTASSDKTARVWDAETGQQLLSIEGHTNYVNSAVFSSDDSRILTAGNDWTARIWDAETGQQLLSIEGHTNYVTSAVFSSDDSRILTASSDGTARIWDAETGQQLLSIEGHTNYVNSAVFSSDDSRILTAGNDWTARIWDAETGQQLLSIEGHVDYVTSAVFSSDDSRILTASSDGTARIWEAETGQQLLSLKGHVKGVTSAVFSSDNSRVLTASNDSTWLSRRLPEVLTDDRFKEQWTLAAYAREHVTRCLEEDERAKYNLVDKSQEPNWCKRFVDEETGEDGALAAAE